MQPVHAIGDILISSRPFADYMTQFSLTQIDLLNGPVLDCPGGASDFGATVRALGGQAVSVDPCYSSSVPALTQHIASELTRVQSWTTSQPDRFPLDQNNVWCHLPAWRATSGTFLADIQRDRAENTGHYRAAVLPDLPFPDNTFALATSGFLLFSYPQHFDPAFHLRAVHELLRVAEEVRLHPLNDSAQIPYPALDALVEQLATDGIRADILSVSGQSDPRDDRTLRLRRH